VANNERPRLLDLFAGAQGCGVGYARAGFEVHAVDIERHDKHPEVESFTVADWRDAMTSVLDDMALSFDVIHASPPCQASTTMSNRYRGDGGPTDDHVNLIGPVRAALEAWGGAYVIENVCGARKHMRAPITLTGGMFGLGVHRPRLFESNIGLTALSDRGVVEPLGVYGRRPDGRRLWTREDGSTLRAPSSLEQGARAMGIDWMVWEDLTEAIPPAYTQWLGLQLIDALARAA
jgi:DNA (cytosine-5)-methyltransferase 1